jgi:adenine phosphoribosyltransferase
MTYLDQIKNHIKDIPDFPKKGIVFKDIQPLLSNPILFNHTITSLGKLTKIIPDYWVGIESRGFIFSSALAMKYRAGVKLIRKPNKLPPPVVSKSYDLEYGSDIIEISPGKGTVVIVDDVYATGGTMNAAEQLCTDAGYDVIDKLVLIDLLNLHEPTDVKYLIQY